MSQSATGSTTFRLVSILLWILVIVGSAYLRQWWVLAFGTFGIGYNLGVLAERSSS